MRDLGVRHLSQVGGISFFSVLCLAVVGLNKVLNPLIPLLQQQQTLMSVSLSSSIYVGLMANGTRRDGAMVGGTEGLTSWWASPSSVPRLPSNTLLYSMIS